MEKWLDSTTVTIWLIIVLVLITLLASSVIKLVYLHMKKKIEHKQRESSLVVEYHNNLIKTSITAQEEERNRIASDLHDSVIGKLTVIRLKNQINYQADEIDSLLQETINETRRISHNLSPPMVGFKCISELLSDVIAPWKKKFNVIYTINILSEVFITENLKIQSIRILQELIINSYKHSQSKTFIVQLKITTHSLTLIVSDQGIGFDPKVTMTSQGIGLNNIALRVHYLKGHYKIKSSQKGTRAIFSFNIL